MSLFYHCLIKLEFVEPAQCYFLAAMQESNQRRWHRGGADREAYRGCIRWLAYSPGFEPKCPGVETYKQGQTQYARITVRDPFRAAFDRIPKGYQRILEYLGANGFKENHGTEYLGCFEEVFEKDGETYMDIYIHADCVGRGNLHTDFSRDM